MDKSFTVEKKRNGRIKCIMLTNAGNIFIGKATCSPNDEFSLDVGLAIAEKRAKMKQLTAIYSGLDKKRKTLQDLLSQNNRRTSILLKKIWAIEDELEILTGVEADE